MMRAPLRVPILAATAALALRCGWAAADAPRPIAAPPVPPPARLEPAPAIDLSVPSAPPNAKIDVPAAPSLAPVAPPPPHEATPADKSDPVPPPRIGLDAPRPPASSPGASAAAIEEISLALPAGGSAVPDAAQPKLARVLAALKADPAARLEIRAYAPLASPTDSKGRRLALARFLGIRDYLVKNGVADERIDARALGSRPNDAEPDRVELYIER